MTQSRKTGKKTSRKRIQKTTQIAAAAVDMTAARNVASYSYAEAFLEPWPYK